MSRILSLILIISVSVACDGQAATVEYYGEADTFGNLALTTPSGQSVITKAIDGWQFHPGQSSYFATATSDRTVLIANTPPTSNQIYTEAEDTVITTFLRSSSTVKHLQVPTEKNLSYATAQNSGAPAGSDIGDVEAFTNVSGLERVAFTTTVPYHGQSDAVGEFPSFGVLKKLNGTWVIDFKKSATELSNSNATLGSQVCPITNGRPFCLGLNEIAALPQSKHLAITQYFPAAGRNSGQIVVLDGGGNIQALYIYPEITDPADASKKLTVLPREIIADPTSAINDERFVVIFDTLTQAGTMQLFPMQEFSYNAATKTIIPISAPVLSSDGSSNANMLFDKDGNLWVGRGKGLNGTGLGIYPMGSDGKRRLARDCAYVSADMSSYRSTQNGITQWGSICVPEYYIAQSETITASWGLMEDKGATPQANNGTILQLSMSGYLLPIKYSGSGATMNFSIGNTVDLGLMGMLPDPDGASGNQYFLGLRKGAVTKVGSTTRRQAWVPLSTLQCIPDSGCINTPLEYLPQWLVAIDMDTLFSPEIIKLGSSNNSKKIIQAEIRSDFTTSQTISGSGTNRMSKVNANLSISRSHDDSVTGGGFQLQNANGFGLSTNQTVEYTVNVPRSGNFALDLRTYTFAGFSGAVQVFLKSGSNWNSVGTATINTNGSWQTVALPQQINLPIGLQTLKLQVTSGSWYLNWLQFTKKS